MRRWGWLAACCLLLTAASPAAADVLVRISKSEQRMAVTIDGTPTYDWAVSTGRNGWTTPNGSFRPYRLERTWFSRRFDSAPMPWSVFFHHGYAVHGTKEIHKLGQAASHGCVRLHPDNAEVLFNLVKERGYGRVRVVVGDEPLSGRGVPVAKHDPAIDTRGAKQRYVEERPSKTKRVGDRYDEPRRTSTRAWEERPGVTVRTISRAEYDRIMREASAYPSRKRGFEW